MRSFLILIAIFLFSLIGCNQKGENHNAENNQETTDSATKPALIKGKVTSTGIFSYYLPTTYSEKTKLPAFFIFDPHGDGNFPLNRYYPWAEKYGFIMVASNVSKNGLPQNQLESIIRQFFQKVTEEISIDPKRLYVMGFSGGSRVASIAAMEQQNIRGMVLCGGGLAYRGLPRGRKNDILLLAGNKDFNLLELMNLDTLLGSNYRHILLQFNGYHQWPDSLNMEDAFLWILFNEMKDSILPTNDTLIQDFISTNYNKVLVKKDLFAKYLLLKKIIVFADGLADVKKYRSQLRQIENSSTYKNYLKKFRQVIAKEQKQEQKLVQNMTSQSFDWWQKEISKLSADSSGNSLQSVSHKRILDYLSLAAYMQCDIALKNHQNNYAGHFIGLYQLIDPKNTEGYYMEAQLAMRKHDIPAVIKALQKTVDLGFNDFDRINNDQAFMPLFNNPEFQTLLDKIRK